MLARFPNNAPTAIMTALGSLSLVACAAQSGEETGEREDVSTAEQAMTSSDSAGDITAMSTYFAEADDPAAAADAIEDDLESPACLTVTETGDVTTLEFDDCVGRLGFLVVSGTLEVTSSTSGSTTTHTLSTDELYLNRAEVAGTWNVTVDSETEERSWDGAMTVTGPYGHEFDKSTTATWAWTDESCVAYSASSEIVGPLGGTRTVEIDGVERCANQCPSAGTVEVEWGTGATVSWTYNGDDTATVTGRRGNVFDVTLPCGYN